MSRWIGFIITILIGIGLGILYGWVIDPVDYVDTTPDSLRQDYQADYVLMVAEIYQAERDPTVASARLSFLGQPDPFVLIQDIYAYAGEVGYSATDLAKIDDLLDGLKDWLATEQEAAP